LLLSAGDDFVLQVSTYIYEVIAETGYPYNQVTMPFRILLGFP
jgi:hypothetical protein